jgi:hypothetical protein
MKYNHQMPNENLKILVGAVNEMHLRYFQCCFRVIIACNSEVWNMKYVDMCV